MQQCSGDAAQGSTYHTTVLALPADKDWTAFASEPTRIITMCSRAYRTVAVPVVTPSKESYSTKNIPSWSLL